MNIKDSKLQEQWIAYCRKRKAAMAKYRAKDWSFARIGQKYGITRQRVQQILRDKSD